MANNEPRETPPGPFRNGRLTDPEDSGETRPNRASPGGQESEQQPAGGQIDEGQTRATPVQPKASPEPTATDPQGQPQAQPIYDPHGQTQGLPARTSAPGAGTGSSNRPQPANAHPAIPAQVQPGRLPSSKKPSSGLRQFVQRNWLWGLLAIFLLGTMSAVGGYGGLLSGQAERRALAEAAAVMDLADQVNLGLEDLQAGRFDVARQRFEFVLNQDPNFPGAADGLVQALQVLNATATPTPPPATPTLTPTRDLRPVEELLAQALAQMKNSDWAGVIDTLNGLRKEDPDYQVTRVDGYLYIALRYRGIDKILNQSNLEGGIYDLSLAEQFGPLDSDALGTRNLARLYIIGSSFWEALPEQAVFYFSQVAAAAPYLRDASGWTARDRYRLSLVQYGDQLAASENWCDAQIQYEAALSMQADAAIGAKAEDAALRCAPPTETPTLTETATLTPTLTLTPSPTLPVVVTPEPTTPVATTPAGTTEVPTAAPTTPVPTTAVPSTPTPTPTPTTPAPTTEVPPPDDPTPTETTAAPPAATTAEPFEEPSTLAPPAATTAAPPEIPGQTPGAPVGLIPSPEKIYHV